MRDRTGYYAWGGKKLDREPTRLLRRKENVTRIWEPEVLDRLLQRLGNEMKKNPNTRTAALIKELQWRKREMLK